MRSQEQVLSTLGSASRGPWCCLSEFQANTSHRKAAAKCSILSQFHSWPTGWTTAHGLSCGHTSLTWCPERVPYGTYQWGMLGWMMKQGAQTLLEGPLLSSSESFSTFLPLKFSVTSKLFFCGMRYMILLMLCPKANSKTTTTAYGSPTISMCQAPYYRSLKISPSALQKFLAPLEG